MSSEPVKKEENREVVKKRSSPLVAIIALMGFFALFGLFFVAVEPNVDGAFFSTIGFCCALSLLFMKMPKKQQK